MIWIVYFWWQYVRQSFLAQLPYILILAGGISNIMDRLYYGCVIDYVPFLNISSFNIADTFITIGAGIILWQNFFIKKDL
jgi:signal peptidase II